MYPPNIGVDIDSCMEFQSRDEQPDPVCVCGRTSDRNVEDNVADKTRIAGIQKIEAMIRLDEREACAKVAAYIANLVGEKVVGTQIVASILARQ